MENEFRVNTLGELFQQHPDIAVLRDGSFVVVWDSAIDIESESFAGYYIAAQRFTAAGERIGGEIVLSEFPLRATQPSVTALRDGGYALAWTAAEESILGREDVFVRAFDADGEARGAARRLNPAGDDFFRSPEAVALPGGGFVAFYSGEEEDAEGTFRSDGTYGRAFDADGRPEGRLFRLNAVAVGDQINPQTARLSNGDTVVIFDSELSTINDAGNPVDDLRGRILRPDGSPRGREFVLSEDNDGVVSMISVTETSIAVAGLTGGRFVATWYETQLGERGAETTYQIRGRIFDSGGAPDSGEFLVNTARDSVPEHSTVAALDGGGFVVLWDYPSALTDTPYADVYGQIFAENGRRLGGEFVVSQTIEGDQEFPTIAALPSGGFVAAWQSEFIDDEYEGIAARIFDVGGLPGLTRQGGRRDERIAGSQLADELSGGGGEDVVRGLAGNDVLRGDDGDDGLTGDDGADRMSGGSGSDVLYGGRGEDALFGGAGEDRLFGGYGGDRIVGGADADVLTGGAGADVFVFGDAGDSTLRERDRVRDFERGKDALDLSGIDANADRSGNQRFDFIRRDAFDDDAGQLRLSSSGVLLGDVDGDGLAEFALSLGADARLGTGDLIL